MKKQHKPEDQRPVHTWGVYTERPRKTPISVCACGNKYLKTRKGQDACLRCFL